MVNTVVSDALSIGSGPVAAVLLCVKREELKHQTSNIIHGIQSSMLTDYDFDLPLTTKKGTVNRP